MPGVRGAILALLLSATPALAADPGLRIESLSSPVKVRLRGLFAVSESIVWASGRDGTVLRTTDAGKSWSVLRIPGAETLDFRDIHGFDGDHAVVMAAGPGDASRVYRTADGGRSWTLVLRNPDAEGFFDCMDFRVGEGRLLGDPVRGRFQVYASRDGGRSWTWTKGPKALDKEAAFAASGTCLRRVHAGTVLVTGGSHARVLFSPDRLPGEWRALEVRSAPQDSSGLFSIAEREGTLIAVGGDFKREADPGPAIGVQATADVNRIAELDPERGLPYPANSGNGLQLRRPPRSDPWYEVEFRIVQSFKGAPSGYRSAIACTDAGESICIATGPGGSDALGPTRSAAGIAGTARPPSNSAPAAARPISMADFGVASDWTALSELGFDSVSIAGRVAWFSGDGGRLARMELVPAP